MKDEIQILDSDIKAVLEEKYLDYATSVLISRAIPNLQDGFKLVHKRILWCMYEEKFKQFTKISKVGGTILGNYHIHGDSITNSILS